MLRTYDNAASAPPVHDTLVDHRYQLRSRLTANDGLVWTAHDARLGREVILELIPDRAPLEVDGLGRELRHRGLSLHEVCDAGAWAGARGDFLFIVTRAQGAPAATSSHPPVAPAPVALPAGPHAYPHDEARPPETHDMIHSDPLPVGQ